MVSQSAQHPASDGTGKRIHIITLCLLCVGVLLLLLAVRSGINLVQLHVLGHETRGRVIRQEIRIEERRTGSRRNEKIEKIECYYAVVSFTTDEGAFSIVSYASGVGEPAYPTDSSVTLVYPRGHAEEARIQQEISGFSGIFGPLLLVVFGAVFIGFGILLRRIPRT